MTRAVILAAMVSACGSGRATPVTVGNTAAARPPCVDRVLGSGTAIAVAVTRDAAVWLDRAGSLHLRALDGAPAVTLFEARAAGEAADEDLLVHAGWVYWTSSAEHAVLRVPLAGGESERVIAVGDGDAPTRIERIDDTIYATTFGGRVLVWSAGRARSGPDAGAGARPAAITRAMRWSLRYTEKRDREGEPVEEALVRTPRDGGDDVIVDLRDPHAIEELVAVDDGIYVIVDGSVWWTADDATALAPVVELGHPADEVITDVAALGETPVDTVVIVAAAVETNAGEIRQVCYRR